MIEHWDLVFFGVLIGIGLGFFLLGSAVTKRRR